MIRHAGLWLAISLLARAAVADPTPPMRPLPKPSARVAATGPVFYVDPKLGDDAAAGSTAKPWKTLQAAAKHLKAGDTLYLRGGVYFETAAISVAGTAAAPITIRSMPGEVAILDGGLREFAESSKTAWEPVKGAPDEYRSTATYPNLVRTVGFERGVWVVGNFADSMVPLHGYKYDADLRSENQYWNVSNTEPGTGIYLGPGLWFDWQTHRIHIRMSPTKLKSQGAANYRGTSDPRTIPLVIGIDHTPLTVTKSKFLRLQDLVIRGSATRTVDLEDSSNIELDGLTIYGGSPALFVQSTDHLKLIRSVVRGSAAPWSSRASMKYRGNSPYLVIASNKLPQSHDWELAFDEFTDGHDGLVIDSIKTLRFHHNWIDNFNDDGIYLTFPPREAVGDDIQIYENTFSRTYTTLAFAQDTKGGNPIGNGIYLFRNIFDLRIGTYNHIARGADADEQPMDLLASRICGDHGTPVWDPLYFYNNTVITAGKTWRAYYGAMLGVMGTQGSKRRVFDNMFVQVEGEPGLSFKGSEKDDVAVDGNLLWSMQTGPQARGNLPANHLARAAHDVVGDPKLGDLARGDFRLSQGSAAIDAGIPLPATWPDTLRRLDKGKPDIGALPAGAPMLRVGPAASP